MTIQTESGPVTRPTLNGPKYTWVLYVLFPGMPLLFAVAFAAGRWW